MGKLIIDRGLDTEIEIYVSNFFENKSNFSASCNAQIPKEIGKIIKGINITSYFAEFNDGTEYPIFGEYNYAVASTNGSESGGKDDKEFIGYSITLKQREEE